MVGVGWFFFSLSLVCHGDTSAERFIEISPGTSVRQVSRLLAEQHIINYPFWFELKVRWSGIPLQAGEYDLKTTMSLSEVIHRLQTGAVRQRRFTIVEGVRFQQIQTAFLNNTYVTHTLETITLPALMERLGLPDQTPEGWFLPETYYFTKGTPDVDILKRAHQAMQRKLAAYWQSRDPRVILETPYQALILASIVEKETADPAEYAMIAAVFYHRLAKGMRLQTDPTVIYGLGDAYQGNLTKQHLHQDTPYNTYVHAGLPPTPIAMPSQAALMAVLHPIETKALYFVAKPGGGHVFSETLQAHNRAVAQYQLRQAN